MSKYIPGNHKHLSLDDRRYIERALNQGLSFKDIAKYLCKDPTTISKEVKAHRLSDWYHKGTFYNAHITSPEPSAVHIFGTGVFHLPRKNRTSGLYGD